MGAGDIATVIGWGTHRERVAAPRTRCSRRRSRCAPTPTARARASRARRSTPRRWSAPAAANTDTCGGDSGGPLMVSDGAFLVLAGLTSWGAGPVRRREDVPGVYTRARRPGAQRLGPRAGADGAGDVSDATVDPGRERHVLARPRIARLLHELLVGLRRRRHPGRDGRERDAHATRTRAPYVARVRRRRGRRRHRDGQGRASRSATPPRRHRRRPPRRNRRSTPTPEPTATPAADGRRRNPRRRSPRPRLAPPRAARWPRSWRPGARRSAAGGSASACTSRAARRPAPAVIEVIRTRRVIGIARARVLRGGTKRIRVKLTPSGRRQLVRSRSGRLTLKVRVRVGRRVLRSKTLTVRR